MSATGDLPLQMTQRADRDNLPANHPLRVLSVDLVTACEGLFAQEQTIPVAKFFGSWARARKAWCAYTGESLL